MSMPKRDNDLFYTCSLIEFIGRKQKLKRSLRYACKKEYLNKLKAAVPYRVPQFFV